MGMLEFTGFLAAIVTLTAGLAAQLSGDYTIDPAGTGARNYKSFGTAVGALNTRGVAGPVRFLAASGTFNEKVVIDPVAGASATRTITFLGHSKGTKLIAVDFNQGHNVIVDGLEFQPSGLYLWGVGSHLEIRNCIGRKAIGQPGAFLVGTSIEFHDNEFYTTILRTGGQDILVHRNRFHGCRLEVENPASNVFVYNNVMTGSETLFRTSFDVDVQVRHNTFSITGTGSTGSNNSALLIYIHNNVFSGSWPKFYNNIIDAGGTAAAVYFYHPVSSRAPLCEFDFNLYNTFKGPLFEYKKQYMSLRDWQIDSIKWAKNGVNDRSSLFADPRFMSSGNLRLHPSSVAVNRAKMALAGRQVTQDFDGLFRGNMRDLGAYELAGYDYYGEGCAGTQGRVPYMEIQGDVGPGMYARFSLTRARPGALALFAVGMTATKLGIGGACSLLTSPLITLPVPLISAGGVTSIQFVVPLNQGISGLTAYSQFAVADPAAAGIGLALSRGGLVRL